MTEESSPRHGVPFDEWFNSASDEEIAEWSLRSLIRSLLQSREGLVDDPQSHAARDNARKMLEAGGEGVLRRLAAIEDAAERIDAFGDVEVLIEGALRIVADVGKPEVERILAGSPGRPPAVPRSLVREEVFRLMDHHGDFDHGDKEWNAQARLVAVLEDKFSYANSTAKSLAARYVKEWRAQRDGS